MGVAIDILPSSNIGWQNAHPNTIRWGLGNICPAYSWGYYYSLILRQSSQRIMLETLEDMASNVALENNT